MIKQQKYTLVLNILFNYIDHQEEEYLDSNYSFSFRIQTLSWEGLSQRITNVVEYSEECPKNNLVMVELSCKLGKTFFSHIGIIFLWYITGVEFLAQWIRALIYAIKLFSKRVACLLSH